MPEMVEIKERALEVTSSATEITALGSMGVAMAGVITTYGDFVVNAAKFPIHSYAPEAVAKPDQLIGVAGEYGIEAFALGFAGVVISAVVGRFADQRRAVNPAE